MYLNLDFVQCVFLRLFSHSRHCPKSHPPVRRIGLASFLIHSLHSYSPQNVQYYSTWRKICFFLTIRIANLYTPLRQIVMCHGQSESHHSNRSLRIFEYRVTEKSAQPKSVFVPLEWTPWSAAVAGYLIHFLNIALRHEYILGAIFPTVILNASYAQPNS